MCLCFCCRTLRFNGWQVEANKGQSIWTRFRRWTDTYSRPMTVCSVSNRWDSDPFTRLLYTNVTTYTPIHSGKLCERGEAECKPATHRYLAIKLWPQNDIFTRVICSMGLLLPEKRKRTLSFPEFVFVPFAYLHALTDVSSRSLSLPV